MTTALRNGVIAIVLLIAAYAVATQVTQQEGKVATVEVTWAPRNGTALIIVRVAMKDRVPAKSFTGSPFHETYAVKKGDAVLVTVDPKTRLDNITCSINVTGQPPVTDSGFGHIICGPVMVT